VPPDRLSIEEILSRLEAGPARIASLTQGLTEAHLHSAPVEGEWSANDLLAHLRACNDVSGGYITRMVTEDRSTLRIISPRNYIRRTNYLGLDFAPSLAVLTSDRAELRTLLKSLPAEAWLRTSIATGAGRPNDRSVHGQADGLTRHERAHLRQIEAVVKALKYAKPGS
jgi:hypothetical protein